MYIGITGKILGLYWDNGKEKGNYRDHRLDNLHSLSLYRDYREYLWDILG